MDRVQKQFYNILSAYFSNSEKSADYSENKEELKMIARANMCVPFFLSVASHFNIKDDELKQRVMHVVSHNYKNLSVQNIMLNKLAENGIKCVVLKGASVSYNYPEPMLRTHGDIDILVSVDYYERSIDILTGSADRDKLSMIHGFHYEFHYEGILVEIHKAVSDYERDEEYTKKYMENALDQINTKSIEHFSFPVLAEDYQAITLLLHTKRHYFESELATKLLLDWAMYIDKIDKDEWNDKIYPLLDELNLSIWADSFNCVCEKYLNINCSDKIHQRFDESIIEDLAEQFISDRIPKDNVEKLSRKEKIKSAIEKVTSVTQKKFEVVKRHKILLVPLWVYVVIRYFYRTGRGWRRKRDIGKDVSNYNKKMKLYERIKEDK
ncbi:MAG: nucleotidyltransferase family protein [Clostridia bacterium]|nr:nucleotidyltransferase family protein [Clostridia bacterium]